MTAIILVTVGILIATLAALMVIFYGGDSFDAASAKAHAATLDNAAESVVSAVRLYQAQKSTLPKDLPDLQAGQYLSSAPSLSGIGTPSATWQDLGSAKKTRKAYVVTGIDDATCLALGRAHGGLSAVVPDAPGDSPTGCYRDDGKGDTVFYAYIDQTADDASDAGDESSRPAPPTDPTVQAVTAVRTAGTRVASAASSFWTAYGRPVRSPSDIVPDFITTMPDASPYATLQSWSFYDTGDRGLYQLSVTDATVCGAINAAVGNAWAGGVIPGGSERSVDEGCYANGGLGLIYVKWYTR